MDTSAEMQVNVDEEIRLGVQRGIHVSNAHINCFERAQKHVSLTPIQLYYVINLV